jgi:hypothetical protein
VECRSVSRRQRNAGPNGEFQSVTGRSLPEGIVDVIATACEGRA